MRTRTRSPWRRALLPAVFALSGPSALAQTIHVWHDVGTALAAAGDVNADGYDDVVIGDLGANEARVFSGADGSLLWLLEATIPSVDFGHTVAGVGDVDADGHDDVLVAGPGISGSLTDPRVVVFSGADGSVLHEYGIELGLFGLGLSAAGLGDVDGDGHADFAIGASNLGPRFVLAFSGATGELLYRVHDGSARLAATGDADADGVGDFLASENGVQLRSGRDGRLIRDYLYGQGWAPKPAGIGDVDGDGYADIAIGWDDGVDVHSGRDGAVLFSLPGPTNAIAGVGDQDEDGVPDLLLTYGTGSRIVSGSDGSEIASLPGGFGATAVGDVNSDGRPDYLWGFSTGGGHTTVVVESLGRLPYCSPAVPNSTHRRATIEAVGSLTIADDALGLEAAGLVPDALGIFLAARQRGWVPHPGGSEGNLCLGSPFGAFRSQAARATATGTLAIPVDLTNVPGIGAVLHGEALHFQCWYRDGATSNFSDAVKTYFE